MVAADEIAVGPQMAVLLAADQKLPDVQRNRLSLLLPFENP
jgi:hypothetical protein